MDKNRFAVAAEKIENYVRKDRPYYSPVRVYALYMDRSKLLLDLVTDFDHAVVTLRGKSVAAAHDNDNGNNGDKRSAYDLFINRWSWDCSDFSAVTFKVLN